MAVWKNCGRTRVAFGRLGVMCLTLGLILVSWSSIEAFIEYWPQTRSELWFWLLGLLQVALGINFLRLHRKGMPK